MIYVLDLINRYLFNIAKLYFQTQSTSKHRYEFIEGQVKPTEDVCDFLESLVESENIIGFVDPLHHEVI